MIKDEIQNNVHELKVASTDIRYNKDSGMGEYANAG